MANIKSAIKRIDVNEENKARNKANKTAMKTQVKKYRKAISEGKIEDAEKLLPNTCAVIDKTAKKGAIHKNGANRRKSILAKELETAKKSTK